MLRSNNKPPIQSEMQVVISLFVERVSLQWMNDSYVVVFRMFSPTRFILYPFIHSIGIRLVFKIDLLKKIIWSKRKYHFCYILFEKQHFCYVTVFFYCQIWIRNMWTVSWNSCENANANLCNRSRTIRETIRWCFNNSNKIFRVGSWFLINRLTFAKCRTHVLLDHRWELKLRLYVVISELHLILPQYRVSSYDFENKS